MKIINPGHIYELRQLGDDKTQVIKFVKRSSRAVQHPEEWPGLQTQEVLRALIDRTIFLDNILPCKETEEALKCLRFALYFYEVRAYRRKKSKTNKTEIKHDDSETPTFNFQYPKDIPFTEADIEMRPIGEDGHIIL